MKRHNWDNREARTLTGRPWRRLRDQVFRRDGYRCQDCKRLFMDSKLECDHIVPLSKGGKDELSNLQTLCADVDGVKGCHSRKTARDNGEKPEIGEDGWPA